MVLEPKAKFRLAIGIIVLALIGALLYDWWAVKKYGGKEAPPQVEIRACATHGGVQNTVGPRQASDGKWYGVVGCDDGTFEKGSAPTSAGPWNHWTVSP